MTTRPPRSTLEEAIADAARGRQEVAAVYLYGSAATESATSLSDVDVAVRLADPVRDPVAARGLGSAIAGDLVRRFPRLSFDVRDLEDLPLAVQGRILTEGRLLMDRDPSRGSGSRSARALRRRDPVGIPGPGGGRMMTPGGRS